MSIAIIQTALDVVSNIARIITGVKEATSFVTTKSLPEVTKLTRVEPLTILSKDCINLDYIGDVNQALLSLFAAYYLQAVAMMTKVNDVEVIRILDRLNPDRDDSGFLLGSEASDRKNNKQSLSSMILESYQHDLPKSTNVALEFDKEDESQLTTISNLSVGKLLNVDVGTGKNEDGKRINITVPMSIRLIVSVIPNNTIAHLLAFKTQDSSLAERFHAWRSGRIAFIKDLIFCQDMIDEHKRALVGDAGETLQEITRRVNNSKQFGLLTGNPSMVSASNLFVITEQVAKDIELKLGGRLSNAKIRERAFENTYAMIIVVIDREWERVTFYTRGAATGTDLSIKEIKSANKSKGPDIADLLKAMQLGQPVSF